MAGEPKAPLDFSPATRAWFDGSFEAPTHAQFGAWESIARGEHTLVVAPTGSGKTLAAFLWALDRLSAGDPPQDELHRCRVLYVSPLKALAVDVERNLRSPLVGIRQQAGLAALPFQEVEVGMRTGDTTPHERRRFSRHPPDILITTPESLYLLLTSAARDALAHVETVIVDEVHAVAGTKRGAHLALSLERLDQRLERPAQRIGLSATVRPVDAVAAYLTGGRKVSIVQPPSQKSLELRVEVPVADMSELPRTAARSSERDSDSAADTESARVRRNGSDKSGMPNQSRPQQPSIWPHVEERVLDLVEASTSTLVFANSRRLAERLTSRLNEAAAERAGGQPDSTRARPPADMIAQSGSTTPTTTEALVVARAHHGSVSREQRQSIEEALKTGTLPAVVATSSLELGIDMGAVDLVVQVEAPPSVASGLQRVGRAGHQVGAVSRGVLFPKHRGDLLSTAVVVERMRSGEIEKLAIPENPLDVLAQHVVAMVAMDDWQVNELLALVRRATPYASLSQGVLDAVLDMLAGRYPSDEFAELRPRLVWDRVTGVLSGRPGAQRLAVTSGGTIPDRGLFGVFIVGETGSRVGELDEEMVYESRVGDVFALGTTSWRIEDITHDRVLVSPAPGQAARLPFWHGDTLSRPAELGEAQGRFLREIAATEPSVARDRVREMGLDDQAADNLLAYLAEQVEAVGRLPDDRTVVVERFRDELGDWQLIVHSPYGAAVHAPWALAVGVRLEQRYGVDVQAAHSDDGMIFRIPDTVPAGWDRALPAGETEPLADLIRVASDEITDVVTDAVAGSALFAARFRECAGRALLLPRRDPGRRTPLWQQRMRSAQLLEVAAKYPTFPIVLETMRECLQDVYDLPGLVELLERVEQREVAIVEVETPSPSPFARSLLFGYIGTFMYEGDSPLAERRAQALSLDSTLLAELLGRVELRELLDSGVIEQTERSLQCLSSDRQARTTEHVADLIRQLGPLGHDDVARRCVDPGLAVTALAELASARRVIEVRVGGRAVVAAIEDAARLRDALGCALPVGIPEAFLEPAVDPLEELLARYARTHGPFVGADVAAWLGLGEAVVDLGLHRLAAAGRVVAGEFSPGRTGSEWCDAEVLRRLRRRSVAALRSEAEPVPPAAFARFLPAWQNVGGRLRGPDGVLDVVEQLAGYAVPASTVESELLATRVSDYQPAMLDELTTAGEVTWSGAGSLPGNDGWVRLHLADQSHLSRTAPAEPDATAARVLAAMAGGGGVFFAHLVDALATGEEPMPTRDEIAESLLQLVWSGHVSNDTFAPVRAVVSGRAASSRGSLRPRGYRSRRRVASPGSVRALPHLTGRWFVLPEVESDPTVLAHAQSSRLLARYGVLTRGSVLAEDVPGGFAAVYRLLAAAEDAGRCRRGYLVDGLGGAQFAEAATIDRLRSVADRAPAGSTQGPADALLLAATDPANPYGAGLPWPQGPESGHRAGRKAGAFVATVGGRLVLFIERGARSILTFSSDAGDLQSAAAALTEGTMRGRLGRARVERVDGGPVTGSALGALLREHGFRHVPGGVVLSPLPG